MGKRILVIQTAFPGDAILTLPLLQKLKEINPDSELSVICIPATRDIFNSSPAVDTVHVLDKRGEHKSIKKLFRFARNIKGSGIDELYSPHRSFRSVLLTYFINSPISVGFSNSSFPYVFRKIVNYNRDIHEIERNLSLINYNGSNKLLPEIKLNNNSIIKVERFIETLSMDKLAAIALGSVWATKKYPVGYFIRIGKYLNEKGFRVLLIGGKVDFEESELVKDKLDDAVNIAGKFTIPESVEVLKSCKLLVCNDSAPTHMAVAANIKVFTIYCSTVPAFGFYPYNEGSQSFGLNDLQCKPCGIHGHKKCPETHFDCGLKFSPDIVINQIEEILS